jgi:hypothetical protein
MHLWNVNKLYMNEHSLLKKSKSWLCLSFQVFTFTLCFQPHCIVLLFQVGRVFSEWVCFLRFCSLCLFCDIQPEHLPPWSWNHVKQKSKYYKGWKTVLDLFAVNFNPEQRPTEVGRLEPKWMMSEFTLPLFHSWVVLAWNQFFVAKFQTCVLSLISMFLRIWKHTTQRGSRIWAADTYCLNCDNRK